MKAKKILFFPLVLFNFFIHAQERDDTPAVGGHFNTNKFKQLKITCE